MLKDYKKKKVLPYTLVTPVVFLMFILYSYPIILTFIYSFQDVSLIAGRGKFIGLQNYIDLIKDPNFYHTLKLTLKYTIVTVTLKITLGFVMALLLNSDIHLKKGLRFLMLIPWALPQVAVAIIWKWILDGNYGYLNFLLQKIGVIEKSIAWLSDPTTAFYCTSIVDAWLGIPMVALMFLSGLSSIPLELYDASKVDGVNCFQRFIYVTLPGIKKVFLIILTLVSIWTFNSFNVINVLTKGGPMSATQTLIYKIYKETFTKFNLGMSSAMSMIVCVLLTFLSLLYWKQIRKENS